MDKVEWVETIEISIISSSSLTTLTRLILAGFFIYFIGILIKFTSQYPVTSYNTSIIEPISTGSTPNDKWGFGY